MSRNATRETDVGVVEAEPVGHARAAVVADEREGVEAERAHQADLVGGHGALGVRRVVAPGGRPRRVAVATEVGGHDRVVLRERRRDEVPHDMGLGIAVQQQDGRAGTTYGSVDAGPVDVEVVVLEALEHTPDYHGRRPGEKVRKGVRRG